LDRYGGATRKDPTGAQSDASPLAIVLGSVLDGIPESFVLGLTVLQGGCQSGTPGWHRALQPPRGHVVLQRLETCWLEPPPGGFYVGPRFRGVAALARA